MRLLFSSKYVTFALSAFEPDDEGEQREFVCVDGGMFELVPDSDAPREDEDEEFRFGFQPQRGR